MGTIQTDNVPTWLAVVIFATAGLVLLLNLGHTADRFARMNRALPWWLKTIGGNYPATYRALGGLFLLAAAVLIYAAAAAR